MVSWLHREYIYYFFKIFYFLKFELFIFRWLKCTVCMHVTIVNRVCKQEVCEET